MVTFTSPANAEYIRIDIRAATAGTYTLSNLQIEVGSTATTYLAHQEQNLTLPLPTGMELCKIGNYKDTIFKNIPSSEYYNSSLVEGGWYKKNEIGKIVLNGSENWEAAQVFTNITAFRYYFNGVVLTPQTDTTSIKIISNKFIGINPNILMQGNTEAISTARGTASGILIAISRTRITDLASFKTWLSTHNTSVYYVLATPTYTQITDTNFINLAENIYTYTGVTHIDCTDEIKPTFNIEYFQDIKTLINN